MAYASHTNTDVHAQLRAGQIPTPLPLLFGQFETKEGTTFEYAERRWHCDDFAPSFPHIIYVRRDGGDKGTRLARVLGRVAYVVVDETDHGPVIEKWDIRLHRKYPTDWVRAD